MKKKTFLLSPPSFSYLLPLMFLFLFTGCEKEAVPEMNELSPDLEAAAKNAKAEKVIEFYGPAEPLGGGVVRSFVQMTKDGVPEAIGVRISAKVLEDLPHDHLISTLRLPNKAENMAFDHIDLDWNPHGHEPDGLYTIPHFDVHFYMVSPDYKAGITDPVKAADYPDAVYVPEAYVPPPSFLPVQLIPYMGVHWTHEFEAPPFTHTFIYGSYDGSFIFVEPMITLDYLVNEADGTEFSIAQPEAFERSGYYPTSYSMFYDEKHKDYVVLLGDMKWYDGLSL